MGELTDAEQARTLLDKCAMTADEARNLIERVLTAALRFQRTGERHTLDQEGWDDIAEALRVTMVVHASPGYREALLAADAEVAQQLASGRPPQTLDVRKALNELRARARESK